MNLETRADTELLFVRPAEEYSAEIAQYRREFLDAGDHMDGCGLKLPVGEPNSFSW